LAVELPSGQAEKQALKTLIAHLAKSEASGGGLPTIPLSLEHAFLFLNGMNAIYIVYPALESLPR
jgi:hypothetical protein